MLYEKNPSDETVDHDDKRVYKEGDLLALTVAPRDERQCYGQTHRGTRFYNKYKTFFASDELELRYWIRMEISEPIGIVKTKGPRLHLHGIVHLPTKVAVINWLITVFPNLCADGRVEVRHIRHAEALDGWRKYCKKQKDINPYPAITNLTMAKEYFQTCDYNEEKESDEQ